MSRLQRLIWRSLARAGVRITTSKGSSHTPRVGDETQRLPLRKPPAQGEAYWWFSECESSRAASKTTRSQKSQYHMVGSMVSRTPYKKLVLGSMFFIIFGFVPLAQAATNLIPNGSFETASGSTPSGWITSTYGSPVPTFTYPAAGNAGTKGVSVTLSANSTGDGHWQLAAPVAVTAGATYTFNDWYNSGVATEIDIAYTNSGGTVSYYWLADVPSSGGAWKSFSVTFTVPSGMTKANPFHLIFNKGTLTVDDLSLVSGSSAPSAPTLNLSASPTTITTGQSSTLTWASTNADTCAASGGWTGSQAVSGTQAVTPASTATYGLTCIGAGGSILQQTTVTVSGTPPVPTVTIAASPASITTGATSTLAWSSTNATSCTASNGWSGTKSASGTQIVSPTATTTYTLACTGLGGTATSSATVAVTPATTSPNLITNGNFESGTTNNPASWSADYWGTLTPTFTYPVTGNNGTKAAQITVSNYSSGAASWDPTAISVTPGTLYTFSDYYKSTVDSQVDVLYLVTAANSISGECSADSNPAYVDCYEVIAESVPAAANFTKFTSTITPPKGTVSMLIQHMLVQNGTLAIDDFSVTQGLAASDMYATGIVSLTFDDGYTDHLTNAEPILQAANMHGTFYMIPGDMNDPTDYGTTYMTTAQMLQMQAAGNDMTSHTADHCDLIALYNNPASAMDGGQQSGNVGDPGIGCPDHRLAAATTSQAEITNSKIELTAMGATPVDNLAYPYGNYTSAIEQQVKAAGFKGARTIDQGFNTKTTVATDPYRLVVQDLDMNTSVATVQSWIDTALANNVWLILVFHQIEANPANFNDTYAETPQTLQSIVSYLSSKNACVQTVSQVLNGTPCQDPPAISNPPTLSAPSTYPAPQPRPIHRDHPVRPPHPYREGHGCDGDRGKRQH